MNQHLFLTVNALAGHDARLDLLGIVLAEYTPYLFILAEVYLYFFGHRKVAAVSAFYAVIVGVHYPFDIMGGIMTGALGALSISVGARYWGYLTDRILKIDARVLGTKG